MYSFRPLQRADLPAFRQILLDSFDLDLRDRVEALADLENGWDDTWSNPLTDSHAALTPEGVLAACVQTYVKPDPTSERLAEVWLEIHPAHRGQGLEEQLWQWGIERCTARLQTKTAGHGTPRLRAGTPEGLTWRIALYEAHGFQHIRTFYRMDRDLTQPIGEPHLPAGLRFERYTPALDRAAFETFNEGFSDHWGFEPIDYADWEQFFVRRSTFRPDYTWLVLAGEEVVAISINRVEPDMLRQMDVGWIGQLATRRAWRKRGLASALLQQSMRTFRAAGYTSAGLGVDSESPTGANAIYERQGFTVAKRFLTYEKPLTPSP